MVGKSHEGMAKGTHASVQKIAHKKASDAAAANLEKKTFNASLGIAEGTVKTIQRIDEYDFICRDIPLHVTLYREPGSYIRFYDVSVPTLGQHTRLVLEKIRQQLVKSVALGPAQATDQHESQQAINTAFSKTVEDLVKKYFPTVTEHEMKFFVSYVLLRSIGLGEVEILMSDDWLEEIAINGARQPIWVFHRAHGWCKTNISIDSDDQIRYYASTIGRRAGRQISVLEPLLDVNINVGDRVNATLMPISNEGNTITIRKFSAKPWTITDFLDKNVMSYEAAALLWHAIQYEMSAIIAGGTASGKTSILNILSNFFPPDQRIISIEDTREIRLPSVLHVVPMLTRLPNSEGRGGVSMLNLLQNSLRMRPDRILVGEIRKPAEAEVLFEAIHTGHSVYATLHANTAEEAVTRLTNPPMNIPSTMLSALSLVIVQYRNRRTGKRRTLEIAEVDKEGKSHLIFSYDAKTDRLMQVSKPKAFFSELSTFTGESQSTIEKELENKILILKWLVHKKVGTVNEISEIMARFYADPATTLKQAHADMARGKK